MFSVGNPKSKLPEKYTNKMFVGKVLAFKPACLNKIHICMILKLLSLLGSLYTLFASISCNNSYNGNVSIWI